MPTLTEQIQELRQRKHYQQAIELIQSQPEFEQNAVLLLELASNSFLLGQWEACLNYFQLILQAHPEQALAPIDFYRMGRAAQAAGQESVAIQYYQSAVQHPQGKSAGKTWHQLGQLYEQQGQIDSAIEAYHKAIHGFESKSQFKEWGMSAYYLGRLYQGQKRWPESERAFLQARQHLASQAELRAEVCYSLGEVSLQQQQAGQAEQYLSESLSIHKHFNNLGARGMTLLKLCQALMLQRRWQEVLKTARQAVEVLEQTQETRALKLAYELMAELLKLMSKSEEAEIFSKKAQELEKTTDPL